ncbi:hypothetical protein [Aquipseudomonas campi]
MSKQFLYVGPDWIMYAGPGGYEYSEMLSPAILLSRQSEPIVCQAASGEQLKSSCLLHPAGEWSSVSASSLVVIYLDPLSAPARTIQLASSSPLVCPQLIERQQDYSTDYDHLFTEEASSDDATRFISALRAAISATADHRSEDERIRHVANELTQNPVGRLDLKRLAGIVGLSAERLRHLFKQQIGMTLSKYKAWRQVHSMFCHMVSEQGPVYDWNTHQALQSAGFYDDSHGYRTITQYFGSQRSMEETDLLLINCISDKLAQPPS